MQPITELPKYPAQALHVVGSGPSLAELKAADIGPGPVVAINYAIRAVEQIDLPPPGHPPHTRVYSLQKDRVFVADCRAPILAHARESGWGGKFGDYIFDCEADFGIPWDTPSIVVCLHLAVLLQCSGVEYHACDSFWGEFGSYDGGQVVYDRRVAHYMQHPQRVRMEAARLGMEYRVR